MLRLAGLEKSFGATRALRGVSLAAAPGRIHALLGGNGSGKSTVVKVLAGVHRADAGTIEIGGARHEAPGFTPAAARAAGIRFVHQDLGLFADMTVAENLAFGSALARARLSPVRKKDLYAAAAATLERFGVGVRPGDRISDLEPADRTLVAITRALDATHGEPAVLVLDEPTAALPGPDADRLLEHLVAHRGAGCAVIYISHRLGEVRAVADDVTVLRDGRVVASQPLAGLDEAELVELLAGPSGESSPPETGRATARAAGTENVLVRITGLTTRRLSRLDLTVQRGEVVGVTGLAGSGHEDVTRAMFGTVTPAGGTMTLGGVPHAPRGPREALDAGVVLSPADRHEDACFLDLPVRANLSAPRLREFFRRGWLRLHDERAWASSSAAQYRIKAASGESTINALSGGNQQKVVLARWLSLGPRVLLLEEPTQGVDLGARAHIHRQIAETADGGAAVLVSSTDLDELARLCDRVVVVADGVVVAEQRQGLLDPASLTRALHQGVAA
jgi:ribose transport system ATP-binding protein